MNERDTFELCVEIAKRAEDVVLDYVTRGKLVRLDRMTTVMDLESAAQQFNLDLEGLLNASKGDFCHDVFGIINHMDRSQWPGTVGDCFMPRYARLSEKETVS